MSQGVHPAPGSDHHHCIIKPTGTGLGWGQGGSLQARLKLSCHAQSMDIVFVYPHTRLLGVPVPCLSHKSPCGICALVSSYLLRWVSTSLCPYKPLVQAVHAGCVSHVSRTLFLSWTWHNACVCVVLLRGVGMPPLSYSVPRMYV